MQRKQLFKDLRKPILLLPVFSNNFFRRPPAHRATERLLLFRITSTRLLTLIVVIYKLGRHDPAFYYKTGCGRVHISLVSLLVENNIKFYSISFTRGLDVFKKPMISVGNIVLTTKIKKRASKMRKLEITKMRM